MTISLLDGVELQKRDRCYQAQDPIVFSTTPFESLDTGDTEGRTLVASFTADQNYLMTRAWGSACFENGTGVLILTKRDPGVAPVRWFTSDLADGSLPTSFNDQIILCVSAATQTLVPQAAAFTPQNVVMDLTNNSLYIKKGKILEFFLLQQPNFKLAALFGVVGGFHLLPTFT